MKVDIQKEHQWLQQLVGEWTVESEAVMEPGQPPVKSTGTETVRSVGGVWIVCEGLFEMPDGVVGTTIMTLGYDPSRTQFVGTFIGSMMTTQWVYEGVLDSAGDVLKLNAEGPSFSGNGKTAKYVDSIQLKSNDHRILTSAFLDENGAWREFMTAHYRRSA